MIEIMETLVEEVEVAPKQMHSKVVMFKEDWLTICSIKYDL